MNESEQKQADAIAIRTAATAVEAARIVAETAAETAKQLADSRTRMSDSVLVLTENLKYVQSDISEIKAMLDNKYVTKEEHAGVLKDIALLQRITFTTISMILLSVLGAIMALVIRK